jgi:hypothetical protein
MKDDIIYTIRYVIVSGNAGVKGCDNLPHTIKLTT